MPFERYRETALHRWLEATFGIENVGVVVLGGAVFLAVLLWWFLQRSLNRPQEDDARQASGGSDDGIDG